MEKQFTQNWHNEPNPRLKHLRRFAGKPVQALEIGCFEGRSTCWLMDNILTHEAARLDCVDPYGFSTHDSEARAEAAAFQHPKRAATMARFHANVAEYGDKVRHWQVFSDEFFQNRPIGPYEIAIIDGGHSAMQALRDLLHAWIVLKAGGVMVIDDIEWKGDMGFESQGPKRAYEAFMSVVPMNDVRIVYRNYIAIVEKVQ
jgi:predicted O-methyltransferase YrrM